MKKSLKDKQIHRLLEDLQSLSLAAALNRQLLEQFSRDFQGMINGNNDKGGGENGV